MIRILFCLQPKCMGYRSSFTILPLILDMENRRVVEILLSVVSFSCHIANPYLQLRSATGVTSSASLGWSRVTIESWSQSSHESFTNSNTPPRLSHDEANRL